MKVKLEELSKLIEYIEEYRGSDYVTIIIDLARTIYMLHYVKEEDVVPVDIQNTSFELLRLMEAFYEAYLVQQEVA